MLEKSMNLTFSLMKPLRDKMKIGTYFTWAALALCVCSVPQSELVIFALAVATLVMGISVGIFIGLFYIVFHKSLFGEDAYTYMQFPISSESIVKGKFLAMLHLLVDHSVCLISVWIFLWICWGDMNFGVTPWDIRVAEFLVEDMNRVGEFLFNQKFSSITIAFFIGTFLIQLVLVCAMLCSGVQLGTILNHVYNRDGRKRYMPVVLMLAGTLIFAGCLYLPTKVFAMVSGGFITVLPLLITMGLEIGLTIAGLRWSTKLLQTKYELN